MEFKCEKREGWSGAKNELEQVLKRRGIPEGIICDVRNALSNGFRDEQGRLDSALLEAASKGDKQSIVKLLVEDADISAYNEDRCTPLHLASEKGHLDTVKLLIDKGADVNSESYSGKTPVFYAVDEGHMEIVQLLHERGANLHAKDSENSTLLHEAALSAHPDSTLVIFLIQRGLNVNAKDKFGNGPLDLAKDEGIQNVLIAAGADYREEVPF